MLNDGVRVLRGKFDLGRKSKRGWRKFLVIWTANVESVRKKGYARTHNFGKET
jgi:hypothetical protein